MNTLWSDALEKFAALAQRAKGGALRRDEIGERLTVYLPPQVATDLRVYCARQRRSLSDAMTAAVELMLQLEPLLGVGPEPMKTRVVKANRKARKRC